MSAYDRVTFHGVTLNKRTMQLLQLAEVELGYELTLVQGSYHSGVSQSAGTHDGGGAVDLAPWDYQRKVKVLRDLGCAAWHRPAIAGLWGEHIHAIVLNDKEASSAAQDQMTYYRQGLNGLADHGPDADASFAPRPSPEVIFHYHPQRTIPPVGGKPAPHVKTETVFPHIDAAVKELRDARDNAGQPGRVAWLTGIIRQLLGKSKK